MRIIFSQDPDFKSYWQEFVIHNDASWRYLPGRIEYLRIYCHKTLVQDCSFVIVKNDLPVAICPLFLEEQNGHRFLSSSFGYQMAPLVSSRLSKKQSKKVQRFCYDQIDELAKRNNVVKCMLQLDPVVRHDSYNILTEYGYLDSSIQTAIIDLRSELKTLWSNLRKSYKSLINNGKENLNIFVMNSQNPDYEIHELYRRLHHKTAGRITRPIKTFDMQFDDLKNDRAMLIGLQEGSKFVAFSYFLHYQNSAYYGSSSDDPSYESKIPFEHRIIWAAIEYYKQRGIRFFETGVQQFGPQMFDYPRPKDINISFFKRGFGGKIIPFYRGIRYFDREFMRYNLESNTKKLLEEFHYE